MSSISAVQLRQDTYSIVPEHRTESREYPTSSLRTQAVRDLRDVRVNEPQNMDATNRAQTYPTTSYNRRTGLWIVNKQRP